MLRMLPATLTTLALTSLLLSGCGGSSSDGSGDPAGNGGGSSMAEPSAAMEPSPCDYFSVDQAQGYIPGLEFNGDDAGRCNYDHPDTVDAIRFEVNEGWDLDMIKARISADTWTPVPEISGAEMYTKEVVMKINTTVIVATKGYGVRVIVQADDGKSQDTAVAVTQDIIDGL